MMDTRSTNIRTHAPVLTIVVALVIASVAFRVLVWQGLNHTSLVFIGLPAILAVVTALMPTPRTATGMIMRVVTLSLLLAGVLLGEAMVCILFAAPIFYLVGLICGLLIDMARRRKDTHLDLRMITLVALMFTPPSLEGVLPGFAFGREEHVSVSRTVAGSPEEVAAALAQTPRFTQPLPLFLRLGFPTPGATSGNGIDIGSTRRVEFMHGHHPGALTLTVRQTGVDHVQFEAVMDDSYIVHWLAWRGADVRWRAAGPGQTEVTWTLAYRRRLDPAWYFKPLERYGVRQAAAYLIDTLATPSK